MARRRPLQFIIAASVAATMTVAACGSSGSDTASGTGSTVSGDTASGGTSTGDTGSGDTATGSDAPSDTAPADTGSSDAASSTGTGSADTSGSDTGSADAACSPDQLATKQAGTLTIATDEPVFEPWFVDDDPSNGEGYEGAVAYAVADQLGYAESDVTWVRAGFDSVISPAPKDFDFDINEFSITPDREKVVDFSSGYYDVAQAVVTTKDSSIAGAKSLADLQDAHLGAQIGTTSLDVISDVIKPSQKAAVFQKNIDAVKALQNGQIDGIVTDLPTAFYMSSAQLDDGVLVGQIPDTGDNVEQFGLLLEKDSPITSCVSDAVDALRDNGTLDSLADQWLAKAGAPELK